MVRSLQGSRHDRSQRAGAGGGRTVLNRLLLGHENAKRQWQPGSGVATCGPREVRVAEWVMCGIVTFDAQAGIRGLVCRCKDLRYYTSSVKQ